MKYSSTFKESYERNVHVKACIPSNYFIVHCGKMTPFIHNAAIVMACAHLIIKIKKIQFLSEFHRFYYQLILSYVDCTKKLLLHTAVKLSRPDWVLT